MHIKNYIKAARLRTLPLSISGVIVGSFLSVLKNAFCWKICFLALLTTIGFQIISNFANDLGDGIKGTDTNREGEERLVASGKISPKKMKYATIITTIFTLCIAILLIYTSFGKNNFLYSVIFFGLGIASIIAAIKYTVGTSAYGYSGFGDLFVFVFFGLVSVVGSYFLYTKQCDFIIFLPAISIGLLSTAVLNLNNMRDIKNDKQTSKNTIVVKMGVSFAKYYHYSLITISFLFACLFVIINYQKPQQFLFIIAYIPLLKHIFFVIKNKKTVYLDGELKKVALSTFLFGILFGLGQVL